MDLLASLDPNPDSLVMDSSRNFGQTSEKSSMDVLKARRSSRLSPEKKVNSWFDHSQTADTLIDAQRARRSAGAIFERKSPQKRELSDSSDEESAEDDADSQKDDIASTREDSDVEEQVISFIQLFLKKWSPNFGIFSQISKIVIKKIDERRKFFDYIFLKNLSNQSIFLFKIF